MKASIFFYIVLFISTLGWSQMDNEEAKKRIDSIIDVAISIEYSDHEKSMSLIEETIQKSNEIGYELGVANSILQKGYLLEDIGDFDNALLLYDSVLTFYTRTDNIRGLVKVENALGVLLNYQGKHEKALIYLQKCYNHAEEINYVSGIATALGNMGLVQSGNRNYDEALNYYNQALKIKIELNDSLGIAIDQMNIGDTYFAIEEYDKSLKYYYESIEMSRKIDDKIGIAYCLTSIGFIQYKKGFYNEALDNFQLAIDIQKSINDKNGLANSYKALGKTFVTLNELDKALVALDKGLAIATELGLAPIILDIYELLSNVYEQKQGYKLALKYNLLYVELKDSIFNVEKNKQLTEIEGKYQNKKKQEEIESKDLTLSHNKIELQLHQAEISNQNFQRNIFILGFIIVFVVAVLFLRVFLQKKKANILLSMQKKEIQEKNTLVEEKNKEMLDSINYAQRIQQALLKAEEHVSEHLPPHFILFKPKDIVSGDFYWAIEQGDFLYLAVSDCTGHGVPGAFMSMLGIAYLNEITSAQQLLSPSEILDQLRHKVISQLGQRGHSDDNKDGMDISLIKFNLKNCKAEWAGANNPIYIIRNGKLQEIKGDKQPIGQFINKKPFKNHLINFQKGDSFYLFSDGYPDQFGGPKGKKLKYKAMKNLLINNFDKDIKFQKSQLDIYFENWKQGIEQIDDVCIVGVTIK